MGPDQPSGDAADARRRSSDDDPTEVIAAVGDPGTGDPADRDAHGDPASDPERPRRRRLGALIAAGVLVLLVVGAYLVDLAVTSGTIERNTVIAGVEVGGLTPEQARQRLQAEVAPRYTASVTVDVHGEKVALLPASAGLAPDIDEAVQAAGTRSASPIAVVGSFFRSGSVPLRVTIDRSALTSWVRDQARRTDVAPVEGVVALRGTTVTATQPVIGRKLEVDKAVTAIADRWSQQGPSGLADLVLPTSTQPVRASAAGTAKAVTTARRYLSGPVTVVAGDVRTTITPAQIAARTRIAPDAADGFTVTVDVAALRAPLTSRIEATRTAPRSATIGLVDGAPKITPSVTGRTVDWTASEDALRKALAGAGSARTWTVAYRTQQPEFSTDDAKAYGIKEVIGEFTTGGFAYTSGQNIKILADRINGLVIKPGATFSLNTWSGPRGAAQGYIEAGIIDNGKPSKAVGGGLSQFATTLYNATYFAGMKDVTHTPHSYYISRYPEGREATVFDGEIDLAFTNDYPTAILVQTIWTENDITVRIWGTKHVQVESVTSDRYDFTAPPQTTIPYGQECVASSGTQGFSVDNTRIIKDLSGKEISRSTSTTTYNGQYRVICEPPPAPPTTAAPPTTGSPTAPPSSGAPSAPPATTPPPTTTQPPPSGG